MRTSFVVVTLLLVAVQAQADSAKQPLKFAEHGFSIEPPSGHDPGQVQQVVSLALPASAGFSPNVNVQVQPFKGSMEDYLRISNEQFKAAGIKVVQEKHDAKTAVLEYTGRMQGHNLHWYARGALAHNGLILATATADESQWASVAATLRQSVDSLRLLP
jgi:hypothetical protein